MDGASKVFGSGVGLIVQSPIREPIEQTIYLSFFVSNNEAEYETIIVGLDIALILVITKLEIMSDS